MSNGLRLVVGEHYRNGFDRKILIVSDKRPTINDSPDFKREYIGVVTSGDTEGCVLTYIVDGRCMSVSSKYDLKEVWRQKIKDKRMYGVLCNQTGQIVYVCNTKSMAEVKAIKERYPDGWSIIPLDVSEAEG